MIKNSDLFFERAKEYQDARNALEDKYSADMEALKVHEGSLYFKEQTEKLSTEYEEKLSALRTEAAKSFSIIVNGMKEAIGRTPATAPTAEQLRLLETLKLRNPKNLKKEDLDKVAESLKGCPLGLQTLSEIALDAGFQGYNRYIDELSTETAADICESPLIKDFLDFNTPRAARLVSESNRRKYGDAAVVSKVRRKPFEDKEDCFRALMGIDGERLQHFCNMVDREEVTA